MAVGFSGFILAHHPLPPSLTGRPVQQTITLYAGLTLLFLGRPALPSWLNSLLPDVHFPNQMTLGYKNSWPLYSQGFTETCIECPLAAMLPYSGEPNILHGLQSTAACMHPGLGSVILLL